MNRSLCLIIVMVLSTGFAYADRDDQTSSVLGETLRLQAQFEMLLDKQGNATGGDVQFDYPGALTVVRHINEQLRLFSGESAGEIIYLTGTDSDLSERTALIVIHSNLELVRLILKKYPPVTFNKEGMSLDYQALDDSLAFLEFGIAAHLHLQYTHPLATGLE